MKKTIIYICIFLAGVIFNTVDAQEKTGQDNPVKAEPITMDPKLNPEEQALILQAGQDNPVKAEPITMDPKLNPDKQALILQAGQDNPVKAEPVGKDEKKPGEKGPAADQMIDGEENNPEPDSGKADNGENLQPVGETPSRITNYRKINGSDTQPKGEQPGKITNYREMNGTNTQPDGNKPEKR